MVEIDEFKEKYKRDSDMIEICNTAQARLIAGARPTEVKTQMKDGSFISVKSMPDLNDAQKERIMTLQWQIVESRDFTEGETNFMRMRSRIEGEELRFLRRDLAFVRLGGPLNKLKSKPRESKPWWWL